MFELWGRVFEGSGLGVRCFEVRGCRFRVWGTRLCVTCSGFSRLGFGVFEVRGLGFSRFGVSGSGFSGTVFWRFGVSGLGFWRLTVSRFGMSGSGFNGSGCQGFEFRCRGSGFRVAGPGLECGVLRFGVRGFEGLVFRVRGIEVSSCG